jgi:hypothetical protein
MVHSQQQAKLWECAPHATGKATGGHLSWTSIRLPALLLLSVVATTVWLMLDARLYLGMSAGACLVTMSIGRNHIHNN